MGVIVSRYLDPRSSEGALIRFAMDSARLVHTVCTADAHFPELTPWNVIDFHTDDLITSLSSLSCWPGQYLINFSSSSPSSTTTSPSPPPSPSTSTSSAPSSPVAPPLSEQQQRQMQIQGPPPFALEYEHCSQSDLAIHSPNPQLQQQHRQSQSHSHSQPQSPVESHTHTPHHVSDTPNRDASIAAQHIREASQWLLVNTM